MKFMDDQISRLTCVGRWAMSCFKTVPINDDDRWEAAYIIAKGGKSRRPRLDSEWDTFRDFLL